MNTSGYRYLFVAIGLLFAGSVDASIPEFFRQLFGEFQGDYVREHLGDYNAFCQSFDLDETNVVNRNTYFEVAFTHDLLTGTDAVNCMRGGILESPYFWHWVEPNPRHSIVLLPDSVLLSELPPPEPYTNYRTYADLDRVPALYLSDLVSTSPKYAHPGCGAFFTFGWCSERETAYIALMQALGYDGKIQQSGIHTWSVLRCACRRADGTDVVLLAHVDNTFDVLRWELAGPDVSLRQWQQDVGRGAQIAWYNRMARSSAQIESLHRQSISDLAKERIRSLVRQALLQDRQHEESGH